MSDFVVLMKARQDIWWLPVSSDGKPALYAREGTVITMAGTRATRSGFQDIPYTTDNFRFFVPLDTATFLDFIPRRKSRAKASAENPGDISTNQEK